MPPRRPAQQPPPRNGPAATASGSINPQGIPALQYSVLSGGEGAALAARSLDANMRSVATAALAADPSTHTGSGVPSRASTGKYARLTTSAADGVRQLAGPAVPPPPQQEALPPAAPALDLPPEDAEDLRPWQDGLPQASTSAREIPDIFAGGRTTKLQRQLEQMRTADPERLNALIKEVSEACERILDRQNFFTEKKHGDTLRAWETIILARRPDLKRDEVWKSQVVNDYARYFLRMRATVTNGISGGAIKAVTLQNWLASLIFCIGQYAHLPDTNKTKDGWRLLVENGLYKRLKEEVSQIIEDLKLERHQPDKEFWGPAHVLLMIQEALRRSETGTGEERLVALMQCGYLTLLLHLLCRPGSISPSCKRYLEQGLFAVAGDLEFHFKSDINHVDMDIRLKNFKGYNENTGRTQMHRLTPVTKVHNLPLEPHSYWLLLFQARGWFGLTDEEFDNYSHAYLKVLPEFEQMPLIVTITAGGHGLTDKAAIATTVSGWFKDLAVAAGLPAGTPMALRRGGAEMLALLMGKQWAQSPLNHNNGSTRTIDTYYTRGTFSMPTSKLILGEVKGLNDGEVTQAALRMHELTSCAVNTMMGRRAKALAPPAQPAPSANVQPKTRGPQSRLSAEGVAAVKNNPDLEKLDEKIVDAWDTLHSYIRPDDTATLAYRRNPVTLKAIAKSAKLRATIPRIKFTDQILWIRNLGDQRTKLKRALTRTQQRKEQNAKTKAAHDPRREDNLAANRTDGLSDLRGLNKKVILDVIGTSSTDKRGIQPTASGSRIPISEDLSHGSDADLSGEVDTPDAQTADFIIPLLEEWTPERVQRMEAQIAERMERSNLVMVDEELGIVAMDETHEEEVAQDMTGFINVLEREMSEKLGITFEPTSNNFHSVRNAHEAKPKGKGKGRGKGKGKGKEKETEAPVEDEVWFSEQPDDVPNYADDFMDDSAEPTVIDLPLEDVRRRYRQALILPYLRAKELRASKAEDGSYLCPKCVPFTHDEAAVTKRWPTMSSLQKHLKGHTEWWDLELEMVTADPEVFQCPGCGEQKSTVLSVRKHMTSKHCPSKEKYIAMRDEHRTHRPQDKGTCTDRRDKRAKNMKAHCEEEDEEEAEEQSDQELVRRVTRAKGMKVVLSDSEEEDEQQAEEQSERGRAEGPTLTETLPAAHPSTSSQALGAASSSSAVIDDLGTAGIPQTFIHTPQTHDMESETSAVARVPTSSSDTPVTMVEDDDVMLSAISGLLNDITLWDEDEVIGRGVQAGDVGMQEYHDQKATFAEVVRRLLSDFPGTS